MEEEKYENALGFNVTSGANKIKDKIKDTVLEIIKDLSKRPDFYVTDYLRRLDISPIVYHLTLDGCVNYLSLEQMFKILMSSGYNIDLVLSKGNSNRANIRD